MPVRRIPPQLPVLPQGDEYARLPRYVDGPNEATTSAEDVARFLGEPSKVVKTKPEYPNP